MPGKSKGGKKKKELEERSPPARGEAAKAKIEAVHASAESRHAVQREAKVRLAAKHNTKAATVVAEASAAHERQTEQKRQNLAIDMQSHVSRHVGEVMRIKQKGAHEVEKVEHVLTAMQEATAEKARVQEAAMQAAQQRRNAQLMTVAAKGHAEISKVETAASKLQAEAEAKAAILDAAASSAAERRAAKLGAIAAKGAAESHKVERVVGAPRRATRGQAAGQVPERGGSSPPTAQPPSPDSVSSLDSSFWPATPPPPKPLPSASTPPPSCAGLMLGLMRAGAPNTEVLLAQTAEDFAVLARKYGVTVPGEGVVLSGSGGATMCT
mmetsp:Transcript_13754/g.35386  ORF Transcript_13754/g.35386 Transcript_13754/m.35386 type:complete len:325 (-) Transcript_13754:135-1109(-)|eukprot:CAMPEP_0115852536 /NCGR_PEP_ID=MMETSP0287-20121206/13048_1 /TAXON_ID=412157 /ORGANISM="Chrysochromulina rotalis, Strain UIO044" /LENGTH=324 /DNA_ID=CAMNT_0003306603 /DNA_START=85 /DNA_END=1059 /DNA_ORIENTATION=+